MAADTDMDLSSFMAVLIMTIGCLVILLVCNVVVIISNPENLSFTTIVTRAYENEEEPELAKQLGEPRFENKTKEPAYIDVQPDKLILYPGEIVVPTSELSKAGGNAFENMLDEISAKKEDNYIVLIQRPETSRLSKSIRDAIQFRGIDVGYELKETGEEINYKQVDKKTEAE